MQAGSCDAAQKLRRDLDVLHQSRDRCRHLHLGIDHSRR
jgi:hypothetical protein